MNKKGKVKFISTDGNEFYATLRKRVDKYFRTNDISKYANTTMVVKTIVLLAAYIIPFIIILVIQPPFVVALLLWLLMGVAMAGIGMSIMHDANHGAYSPQRKVNTVLGYSLYLLGGSVFNWKLQHNILHHTYTNVTHMDEDIDDKVVLRFSPHTPVKKIHRLQRLYALFFYGIMTLYWVTAKDFLQFARYTKNGLNKNTAKKNRQLVMKMALAKGLYFFFFLAVPVLAGIPFWQVLIGFLLLHFTGGIILTIVFQLAHTVEGTDHPLPDEKGNIENSWAIHQMNTTVNFSRKNRWLSWYVGGLNFQVEHHLFPQICHVHYPKIASIVKNTAKEFDVPYLENKSFGQALKSHFATLHRFGKLPDWDEAIG